MILAIDAGNTRIKWGLRDGEGWVSRGAIATAEAIRLGATGGADDAVDSVFACCVAGPVVEATIAASLGRLSSRLVWCRSGQPMQCGVANGYADPARLGADRWLAMLGAWGIAARHAGGDCLVVNAGTATTIDVLKRTGGGARATAEFAGGVILPGFELMKSSLARNTAQLPLASGAYRDLPRTTDDAIVTGCLEAQAGAIAAMSRRLGRDSLCILSGGAAPAILPLLAPLLPVPVRPVEDLVLEGLARLAAEASVLT